MEEQDEIVVFRHFNNSIDANIAKTKLDAYGVPCFLTEENMSNLYPGQHLLAFKTRLHIFSKDVDQAHQILDVSHQTEGEDICQCPKCNSLHVIRDFPKDSSEDLTTIFFGVLFPHKKVNRCQDCDFEF